MYTIKLNKHKNYRLHGIVNKNAGVSISIINWLSVQLDNVVLLLDVMLS